MELSHIAPVEDYFAGASGSHGLEALFEVFPVIAVGYYLVYLESGLEHYGHFVPGLVHFAAVDSAEGELVEDDVVPVDGHLGW